MRGKGGEMALSVSLLSGARRVEGSAFMYFKLSKKLILY